MRRRHLLTSVILLGAIAPAAHARLVGLATEADLLKLAEQFIKDNPKDPEGYFCLGRIRMIAWTQSLAPDARIPYGGITEKKLPQFMPEDTVMLRRPGGEEFPQPAGLPEALQLKMFIPAEPSTQPAANDATRLVQALEAYRKAVTLDGTKPLYRLALASAYEETARVCGLLPADVDWAAKDSMTAEEKQRCDKAVKGLAADDPKARELATKELEAMIPAATAYLAKIKPQDEEVQARLDRVLGRYWQMQAVAEYRKAYEAALEANLAMAKYDPNSDTMISAEAGERLLILFKHIPIAAKAGEIDAVKKAVETLNAKPRVMMFDF